MAPLYYGVDPWYAWTGTSATASAVTWQAWTTSVTTSSQINVWADWNMGTTAAAATTYHVHQDQLRVWAGWTTAPAQVTEAQLEEYRRQRRETEQQSQEKLRRAQTAKEKAKALLLDHLEPEQARTYEETGHFDVEVGNRTFRINRGTHGNVHEIHVQDGKELIIRSFCIPSRIWDMPEPDVHLTQKLMLEGGEESLQEFHRIANITERRGRVLVAA